MTRRLMITIATLGATVALGAASLSRHTLLAAPGTTTLDINIGGGYALIFSKDLGAVDVGSIAPPTTPAQRDYHYERHALRLTMEHGTFDIRRSTIAPVNIGSAGSIKLGWDLTGYRVRIDGADPVRRALALPDDNPAAAAVGCGVVGASLRNLAFSPLLARLAPADSTLKNGWESELDGRLELASGTVSVEKLAEGCVDYLNGAGVRKHRQRIASGKVVDGDGIPGVRYKTARSGSSVTLEFFDYQTGYRKGRVVLNAGPGRRVVLNLDPRLAPVTTDEELHGVQQHFEMFYRLLSPEVPKEARLLPRWSGPLKGESPVTPGEGCGSPRFVKAN
jgi:hypothetical protein